MVDSPEHHGQKFRLKHLPSLIKKAALAWNKDNPWRLSAVGIGALVFGATGVFFHLQISINRIWEIEPDPGAGLWRFLINRTRSFGFVLIIAFLLLISFIVSAMLTALQGVIDNWFPDVYMYIAKVLNILISLGVIALLFAMIFKYLPDAHIKWRTVWIGAFLTSFLFTAGKELLSFYFGEATPGSVYGAAGSIIIVMLWVSYSSLIMFYGAEFTWAYAKLYGHGIKPKSYARSVDTNKSATLGKPKIEKNHKGTHIPESVKRDEQ